MIVSLSNSLKAIALNDVTKKLLCASVQSSNIQFRFKSVEEKLGLPAKPKRPTSPYFRFAKENRPSVVARHPNWKSYEINTMLGTMWQSLSAADRERFKKEYSADLIKYYSSNDYTKYKSSLSNADKRRIKEMKVSMKEQKELMAQKKRLRHLDKPKRPMSSFIRYYTGQSDRKEKESHKDYMERVTARWNAMSETEKEKFKTSAEEEAAYKKALLQWEQEMQELELGDVVRSATKKIHKTHKTKDE